MAVFGSETKVLLKRLVDKAYESSQEREELLARLPCARIRTSS